MFYFVSYIFVGISLGFYFSTKKKKERKSLATPEESEHLPVRCKTMNYIVLYPNSVFSTLTTEKVKNAHTIRGKSILKTIYIFKFLQVFFLAER